MKKNILTIVIIALALINLTLTAVLVFVVVPTSSRTDKLIQKVVNVLDLELESKGQLESITIDDIQTYTIENKLTIALKAEPGDKIPRYAVLNVSLAMNTKSPEYTKLEAKVIEHENYIEEFITEEFSKYTRSNVEENKEAIKVAVLERIAEHFDSNFIISVTFGNMVVN